MSRDIPPPLDPKEYPNVRFWTAKSFRAYWYNLTGETDGMAIKKKQCGRRRRDDDAEDSYLYLENMNGTQVSWDVISKIGQKARRIWFTLKDVGMAPLSWGRANDPAELYFNSEMLNAPELEFFRYCEGNWKLARWATRAYPSFAKNHLKPKGC